MSHNSFVTAILLAGGVGSRMGGDTPKQFLPLHGKSVALHSFDRMRSLNEIDAIIVVCDPNYQYLFPKNSQPPTLFACPGNRRQDSLFNATQILPPETSLVLIHDAARPFATAELFSQTIAAAELYGAATTGFPLSSTVRRIDEEGFAVETLNRDLTWEIQTPQAMRTEILRLGFLRAHQEQRTVTDDVALAELIDCKIRMVRGGKANIKLTTPEDLAVAEQLSPC